jgi:hypothetical protein
MLSYKSEWSWRIPAIMQAVPSAMLGLYIACGLLDESPRWLYSVGKKEQCLAVLAKLHANDQMDDELVLQEYHEIEAAAASEDAQDNSYLSFFKTKGNRKRLAVIAFMAVGTQLSGNGLVTYYLSPILKLVGITQPVQQAGINGGLAIWNLIIAFTGAQFVERWGRRPFFLLGISGMLGAFIVVTGLSGAFASGKNAQVGIAVIPFLYIFYGFYDICMTTLPNLCE